MSTESERNSALRQQVAELTANNERLREALNEAMEWNWMEYDNHGEPAEMNGAMKECYNISTENPAASLSAIQADAVDKFISVLCLNHLMSDADGDAYIDVSVSVVEEYANRLRGGEA